MEVAQQYRELIEDIVLNNARVKGNEDLAEDFCSETFKRSYMIISAIKSVDHIESYLEKVANSAIIEVLKTSGRLARTTSGYKQIQQINQPLAQSSDKLQQEIVYDIPDPAPHFEEAIIEKETVQKIAEILMIIDSENAEKQYLQLFNMRYIQNLKQKEIAEELGISQGEVSKRLVEVTSKINEIYIS